VSRPFLRFVPVKTVEQQAAGIGLKTREVLLRQRVQATHALRGPMAEYGVIAPQGPIYLPRLAEAIADPTAALPDAVRELGWMDLEQITEYDAKIKTLEHAIRTRARQDGDVRRLMTIPGLGPICAMAIQAFAPPMERCKAGRDASRLAWHRPAPNPQGGKPKLGKTIEDGAGR
jgi:transposase